MFRILIVSALCLLFAAPTLAGEYDGVWVFDGVENSDYFLVNQNAGTFLMVGVNQEMDGWDAFVGLIGESNTAEMGTLLSSDGEQIEFTATFTSLTTGTVVIHSCVICDTGFPLEVPLPFTKIF